MKFSTFSLHERQIDSSVTPTCIELPTSRLCPTYALDDKRWKDEWDLWNVRERSERTMFLETNGKIREQCKTWEFFGGFTWICLYVKLKFGPQPPGVRHAKSVTSFVRVTCRAWPCGVGERAIYGSSLTRNSKSEKRLISKRIVSESKIRFHYQGFSSRLTITTGDIDRWKSEWRHWLQFQISFWESQKTQRRFPKNVERAAIIHTHNLTIVGQTSTKRWSARVSQRVKTLGMSSAWIIAHIFLELQARIKVSTSVRSWRLNVSLETWELNKNRQRKERELETLKTASRNLVAHTYITHHYPQQYCTEFSSRSQLSLAKR